MIAKVNILFNNNSYASSFFSRVETRMKEEHKNYYDKPCGITLVQPHIFLLKQRCGFMSEKTNHIRWLTCGGNHLHLYVESSKMDEVLVYVYGRRHGIPWWCLPPRHEVTTTEGFERIEHAYFQTQEPEINPWESKDGSVFW